MNRRTYLGAAASAGLVALAGCSGDPTPGSSPTIPSPTPPPVGSLANPSFEEGLNRWLVGEDLPEDPNHPGQRVDNNTGVTDARASDGEYSVAFFIDGVADDGTLWLSQPVDLSAATTLSVDVYSPEESFNTLSKVAAYAGPRRDELAEGDFDTSQAAEDHAGWRTYEYPVSGVEDGLVAVGISVVWETTVTRWVDNVRLE